MTGLIKEAQQEKISPVNVKKNINRKAQMPKASNRKFEKNIKNIVKEELLKKI